MCVRKHIKLAININGVASRLAHIRISSYFMHLARLICIVHWHLWKEPGNSRTKTMFSNRFHLWSFSTTGTYILQLINLHNSLCWKFEDQRLIYGNHIYDAFKRNIARYLLEFSWFILMMKLENRSVHIDNSLWPWDLNIIEIQIVSRGSNIWTFLMNCWNTSIEVGPSFH